MPQFTRTGTTTILVAVLVICGLSIPNFVSDETIAGWPKWTQGRITLAPELQGGTSILLEVDRTRVREFILKDLLLDVRNVLRDNGIRSASPLAIRSDSVEVRPLAGDFEAALAKLNELSKAFNGVRTAEVTDARGGLIRVTPTEASIQEHEQPITNRSVGDVGARLIGIRANVRREGPWRVRVQVPSLGPEELTRSIW